MTLLDIYEIYLKERPHIQATFSAGPLLNHHPFGISIKVINLETRLVKVTSINPEIFIPGTIEPVHLRRILDNAFLVNV